MWSAAIITFLRDIGSWPECPDVFFSPSRSSRGRVWWHLHIELVLTAPGISGGDNWAQAGYCLMVWLQCHFHDFLLNCTLVHTHLTTYWRADSATPIQYGVSPDSLPHFMWESGSARLDSTFSCMHTFYTTHTHTHKLCTHIHTHTNYVPHVHYTQDPFLVIQLPSENYARHIMSRSLLMK